jgi:glycosyltransferase involved in cell wall biosynthesis
MLLERGVDCRLFDPARRDPALRMAWGAGESDLVALHVGRLAPEKNIDLFVRSCRRMLQQEPRLRCVVVGDGPLYGRLRRENPDFVFCGVQTGKSLAAHYASADLFLFPSKSETFGNVTLEAMASGLAVLAYDYAAARRHISDGVNGCLVPFADDGEFQLRGIELVQDPERLSRLREAARIHALGISWSQVVRQFETYLGWAAGQRQEHRVPS